MNTIAAKLGKTSAVYNKRLVLIDITQLPNLCNILELM